MTVGCDKSNKENPERNLAKIKSKRGSLGAFVTLLTHTGTLLNIIERIDFLFIWFMVFLMDVKEIFINRCSHSYILCVVKEKLMEF